MHKLEEVECGTCQHIGASYWGDSWNRIHHCGKSSERRRDAFRPSGDFADDFMSEFRKFYDATANQKACGYYEQCEPLTDDDAALLQTIADAGREGAIFKFFSPENYAAGKLRGKFVDEGERAYPKPARGERRYRITDVGKSVLALRAIAQKDKDNA